MTPPPAKSKKERSRQAKSNSDNKSTRSANADSKSTKVRPSRKKKALSHSEADALTLTNQTTSRLLRLPAELRNRIFALAFTEQLVVIFHTDLFGPNPGYDVIPSNGQPFNPYQVTDFYPLRKLLARTTVCRQIWRETASLPLLVNEFRAEDVGELGQMAEVVPLAVQQRMARLLVALLFEPSVRELRELVDVLGTVGARSVRVLMYRVLQDGENRAWVTEKVDLLEGLVKEAGLGGRVECVGV
ncbi:hypothetical protein J1614_002820 [Plenodomus biglobosus]|nr:hypothetical protein J1614_002820 [Plenodomus biglobosus]